MSKKLWMVEVTYFLHVVAEDEDTAERLAQRHAREEQPMYTFAHTATRKNALLDWMDAHPYGGDGDKTVKEWLDEIE